MFLQVRLVSLLPTECRSAVQISYIKLHRSHTMRLGHPVD